MRSILKREFQQGKRRDMTKFKLGELSSVDRPAQAPAKATIMKRKHGDKKDKKEEDEIAKNSIPLVTSEEDGHAHIIHFWPGEETAGTTNYAISTDGVDHNHSWLINAEGQVEILLNDSHSHAVERDAVVAAVVVMVNKQDIEADALEKIHKAFPEVLNPPTEDVQMDELQKQLDRSNAVVALSADRRTYFDKIEKTEDQDAFLAKSADEQAVLVTPKVEKKEEPKKEVAKVDDDIVYTATNGSVFTKADDPRLVAAIVSSDETQKKLDAQLEKSATSEFEKRAATELAHLPGTVETRGRLLKSIESIEDEGQRAEALKSLRAGSDAAESHTEAIGTSVTTPEVSVDSPVAKLNALAEIEKTANGGTHAQAFSKVCDTPEGQTLYAEHRQSMIARQ